MYHPDPNLPAILRAPAVVPAESSMRLDDLIAQTDLLTWQEGVAIVQALCALQVAGSATAAGAAKNQSARGHVPDASRMWVTETGEVIADLGPHQADAAIWAAWLLGTLLTDRSLPAQLRLFQIEAASLSSRWSLRDFSHGLEPFERDHRSRLIRAAYRRCRENQRRAAPVQSARTTPSVPPTGSNAIAEDVRGRGASTTHGVVASSRWLVPVSVAAAALVGMAVGAMWWRLAAGAATAPSTVAVAFDGAQASTLIPGGEAGGADGRGDRQPLSEANVSSRTAATPAAGRVPKAGAPGMANGDTARTKAFGSKSDLAPARAVPAVAPSRNASAAVDRRGSARPASREPAAARAAPRPGAVAPGDGTVRMIPSIRELGTEEAEAEAARPAVYSAADRDVEPPVAVRQQLPTGVFESSRSDVASMDLWISEDRGGTAGAFGAGHEPTSTRDAIERGQDVAIQAGHAPRSARRLQARAALGHDASVGDPGAIPDSR